ncbi:MAG: adenosylcobinamide-GDP ribazoletransferase [Rhodobacteraceae bacterium]|nr:MAG: adenosylcobinamide-GDP ribazoletransferase [Paracoccaceae bacterium]
MSLRQRSAELRLAVIMLTRLPAGRLKDPVPSLAQAAWAFPLVGLIIGAAGWAVLWGAQAAGLGAVLGAILAYGTMARLTGALHLDGLADFADGIGGGRDKARALEIMRDSRIGSYGVLALIFAVALGVSALAQMDPTMALAALLLASVASRLAMLLALTLMPPARGDGLGVLATGGTRGALLPGAALVLALAFWLGAVSFAALVALGLITALVARLALRRIGGQTGDVLGAVQVTGEVAALVVLSGWLGA